MSTTVNHDWSSAFFAATVEHAEVRFSDLLREPTTLRDVRVGKGKLSTACWSWDGTKKRHLILLGEALLGKLISGDPDAYTLRYYRHELEHALSTERDLVGLNSELNKMGIPFSLLNLAEDARIEALARKRWGNFGWLDFEKPLSDEEPAMFLLAIIQADGDREKALEHYPSSFASSETCYKVHDFYLRFVRAPSTFALLPILTEWIAAFPESHAESSHGEGDLVSALSIQIDSESLESIAGKNASELLDSPDAPGGDESATPSEMTYSEEGNGEFRGETTSVCLDTCVIERAVHALRPAFRRGISKVTSHAPLGRFDTRRFVRGAAPFVKKELSEGRRRSVWILYDCSGSMSGPRGEAGLHFLAAVSRLSASGAIDARVVFTKGSGSVALYQQFKLPIPDGELARIEHNGSRECFEPTLRAVSKQFKQGDIILAYTDGDITDRPIDRRTWHKQGVFSTGLVVGSDNMREQLERWFDKGVVADTLESLAQRVCQILRNK